MRKVLLFIAAGCLIAGVILFVCVGASVDFDFMKFTSMKFVTNTHEIQRVLIAFLLIPLPLTLSSGWLKTVIAMWFVVKRKS